MFLEITKIKITNTEISQFLIASVTVIQYDTTYEFLRFFGEMFHHNQTMIVNAVRNPLTQVALNFSTLIHFTADSDYT